MSLNIMDQSMIQQEHPSIITNIPSIDERAGTNIVVHERDEEYENDPLLQGSGGASTDRDLVNT